MMSFIKRSPWLDPGDTVKTIGCLRCTFFQHRSHLIVESRARGVTSLNAGRRRSLSSSVVSARSASPSQSPHNDLESAASTASRTSSTVGLSNGVLDGWERSTFPASSSTKFPPIWTKYGHISVLLWRQQTLTIKPSRQITTSVKNPSGWTASDLHVKYRLFQDFQGPSPSFSGTFSRFQAGQFFVFFFVLFWISW